MTPGRSTRWPAGPGSKPLPQFLAICWEGPAGDGTTVRRRATLCRRHRQEIALGYPSARGTGLLGESCDLCDGREPRVLREESCDDP